MLSHAGATIQDFKAFDLKPILNAIDEVYLNVMILFSGN